MDCHFGRHITLKLNSLAIFDQLEVNRKHHKSKEHDNPLANIKNKAQSLCLMNQRPALLNQTNKVVQIYAAFV